MLSSGNYLSNDDISFDGIDFATTIPLITAGVSYGKTTYAVEKLADRIQEETGKQIKSILFLTPNRAILEQLLKKHSVDKRISEMGMFEFGEIPCPWRTISVACLAKPGLFLEWGNEITYRFDLIVLDECHRQVEWCKSFKNNLLVWDWIRSILGSTIVVGLTGTPQLLLSDCMHESGLSFADVCCKMPPKHKANHINVIPYMTVKTVCSWLLACRKANGAILIYAKSAKDCYSLSQQLPNAGFIVSRHNSDVPRGEEKTLAELMDKQIFDGKSLRDFVIENERVPKEIDYLIINDSCCEGMNLHDDRIKTVVCESPDIATIIQVMGRIRGDIETLYVCYAMYRYRNYEKQVIQPFERFLDGINEPGYLKCALDDQESIIAKAQSENKKPKLDIRVYQDRAGKIHFNPFYKPIIGYEWEMVRRLRNDTSMQAYFNDSLSGYSPNGVCFLSAERIRNELCAAGRNEESSSDLICLFGLDEADNKVFSSNELTLIAKRYFIKPSGKGKAGRKTLLKAIKDHPQLDYQSLGQRTINGKRATYYEVQKTGG